MLVMREWQRVYLVLDVSGSMFGEPMQSMLNGVDGLLASFCSSDSNFNEALRDLSVYVCKSCSCACHWH